ncbi:MAG TPA: chitobiase/beta-hexosaminidase C-terminal domain-containing protein [Terracidiphilus sp.]|nr:chitobiase/beta-hexosaminidase C-terminal domain-containing protein [Terracidiphilus sp.]
MRRPCGYGSDSTGAVGYLDDMWKRQPVAPAPPTAEPTFSPPPGWYTTAQTVTITDSTTGAKIYYTDQRNAAHDQFHTVYRST